TQILEQTDVPLKERQSQELRQWLAGGDPAEPLPRAGTQYDRLQMPSLHARVQFSTRDRLRWRRRAPLRRPRGLARKRRAPLLHVYQIEDRSDFRVRRPPAPPRGHGAITCRDAT